MQRECAILSFRKTKFKNKGTTSNEVTNNDGGDNNHQVIEEVNYDQRVETTTTKLSTVCAEGG